MIETGGTWCYTTLCRTKRSIIAPKCQFTEPGITEPRHSGYPLCSCTGCLLGSYHIRFHIMMLTYKAKICEILCLQGLSKQGCSVLVADRDQALSILASSNTDDGATSSKKHLDFHHLSQNILCCSSFFFLYFAFPGYNTSQMFSLLSHLHKKNWLFLISRGKM